MSMFRNCGGGEGKPYTNDDSKQMYKQWVVVVDYDSVLFVGVIADESLNNSFS